MTMARQGPTDEPFNQVRGSVWLLAAALTLVAVAILLLLRPLLGAREVAPGQASTLAAAPAATRGGRGARQPGAPGDDTRPARPVPRRDIAPPPGGAAAPGDAAAAAGEAAAEPSGIALFPPPGTDPPKPGLIVPDDFALPPGYVRHYQVTDDGTPLPPILMFHPDFEWVDAQGRPITLPADHVVPPELAPPGMPLQRLEIPDTHVDMIEQPPPEAQYEPAEFDR